MLQEKDQTAEIRVSIPKSSVLWCSSQILVRLLETKTLLTWIFCFNQMGLERVARGSERASFRCVAAQVLSRSEGSPVSSPA